MFKQSIADPWATKSAPEVAEVWFPTFQVVTPTILGLLLARWSLLEASQPQGTPPHSSYTSSSLEILMGMLVSHFAE